MSADCGFEIVRIWANGKGRSPRVDRPPLDVEQLTPLARAGELIMLQLRLPQGVRFDELQQRWGVDGKSKFAGELEMLQRQGLISVDDSGFRLQPRGWILADAIAGQFVQATSDN